MSLIETSADHSAALRTGALKDYFALLKPSVMSLVVFTAFVGMLLAPGGLNPVLAAVTILSISLGAGGSAALNMWYDADIDAIMSRTLNRPIPSGRVTPDEALGLGIVLSAFSVITLGLATNWLASGLLAFTIFFYAVIYTMWLKRSTPQNIVIGGAAGAFPPAVAWAAVTGSVGVEALVLFLIIFLWTPPHFWALALYKQSDYGAAGVPMLPNVAGDRATKRQILLYSALLVLSSLLPALIGLSGLAYAVIATCAGAVFLLLAWRLFRAEGRAMRLNARALFAFSLSYLFVVFLALLADHWLALVWSAA